ncbi:hypothetical protein [Defluviimonas aestuarii]|uniref:helix-turn-helix transcriptional regulator n=1 Tax=Albidovulum aestuarii TaxID=1130726 RepID=UPI0030157213
MATTYSPVTVVAERLHCHSATVWRKAKTERDFPKPIRIGGMTRWSDAEIDAYLAKAEAAREAA